MMLDADLYKLLVETSKIVRSEYLNNFWSTLGGFIVATGWLYSSEDTRKVISKNETIRVGSMTVVVTVLIIHLVVLYGAYSESETITASLINVGESIESASSRTDNSEQRPAAQVNHYTTIAESLQVRWYWPLISGTLNGLLVALIILQLNKIKATKSSD